MLRPALALALSMFAAGVASRAAAQELPAQEPPVPVAPPAAAAAPAPAAPELSSFGAPRQVVISSDLFLNFAYTTKIERSNVDIKLAADYFVLHGISLGAVIGYSKIDFSTVGTSVYTVGARAGYNYEFSPLLSFWPRIGVELRGTSLQASANGSNDRTSFAVVAFVPALWHPTPHFFVGFGPYASQEVYANESGGVSGSDKQTEIGARLVLGGYFGI